MEYISASQGKRRQMRGNCYSIGASTYHILIPTLMKNQQFVPLVSESPVLELFCKDL